MRHVTLRGDSWFERYELYYVWNFMEADSARLSNNKRSSIGVI